MEWIEENWLRVFGFFAGIALYQIIKSIVINNSKNKREKEEVIIKKHTITLNDAKPSNIRQKYVWEDGGFKEKT